MKKNPSDKHLVWFITGTSKGFGHELVRAALQRGDSVIATSRTPEKVAKDFPEASDRLLTVSLDLRNSKHIDDTVKKAVDRFKRIDVLANNAGHGLIGAIEEATDEEIAKVYDTNVLGLLRVTRAVLPYMRKQHSGHIVNFSSIGGLVGMAGWGIYNSTKFAIEGLSEALAHEVEPLGIKVTIVEPGPFRTDFLGDSMLMAAKVINDYDQTAGKTRKSAVERKGKQPGDPALAADAVVQAVISERPPLHLLLGGMAFDLARHKLEDLKTEFESWREVTLSSDFK